MDPRAPKSLPTKDVAKLKKHSDIAKAQKLREAVSRDIRLRFGSIAKLKGTELYDTHLAASSCFHATKKRLYRSAEERNRKNFIETIDTKEVNN